MINRKNEVLDYLKIMEGKIINMLCTDTVVRKINNANNKGYIKKKLNEEINIGDIHHAETILKSFKLKKATKNKD